MILKPILCGSKLKGTKTDQNIFLDDTEAPAIAPFNGDHPNFVQDAVKDSTEQESVSNSLIMSQETGEEAKPQLHKFREDAFVWQTGTFLQRLQDSSWICPLYTEA